jgi:hypothetical protein
MTQTKTERQAAAQKATATRQGNKATASLTDARNSANTAFGHGAKAVRSARDAAVLATKSVINRAQTLIPGS